MGWVGPVRDVGSDLPAVKMWVGHFGMSTDCNDADVALSSACPAEDEDDVLAKELRHEYGIQGRGVVFCGETGIEFSIRIVVWAAHCGRSINSCQKKVRSEASIKQWK